MTAITVGWYDAITRSVDGKVANNGSNRSMKTTRYLTSRTKIKTKTKHIKTKHRLPNQSWKKAEFYKILAIMGKSRGPSFRKVEGSGPFSTIPLVAPPFEC